MYNATLTDTSVESSMSSVNGWTAVAVIVAVAVLIKGNNISEPIKVTINCTEGCWHNIFIALIFPKP